MSGLAANFDANFSAFVAELNKVDIKLKEMSTTLDRQADPKLRRMVDALNGTTIARNAAIAADAVSRIGGTANLTTSQLTKLAAPVREFVELADKRGLVVADRFREIAQAADLAGQKITQAGKASPAATSGGGLLGSAGASLLTGLGLGTGAGAGLAAFTAIKAQLTDIGQAAAALGPVRQGFERLAGGADAANASLSRMRAASRGMIDDLTLITASNRGDILGITRMGVDMAELTGIATKLGRAMGLDAAQGVDTFTIALARQSQQRLDDLGIKLSVSEANERYAASIGTTADKLTDEQKALAFVTEGMKAARVEAAKLSDDLTSAEQWTAVRTQLQGIATDFGDILLQIQPVTDAIGTVAELLRTIRGAGIGDTVRVAGAEASRALGDAYGSLGWMRYTPMGLALGASVSSVQGLLPKAGAGDIDSVLRASLGGGPASGTRAGRASGTSTTKADAKADAERAKRLQDEAKFLGTDLVLAGTKAATTYLTLEAAGKRMTSVATVKLVADLVAAKKAAEEAGLATGKIEKALASTVASPAYKKFIADMSGKMFLTYGTPDLTKLKDIGLRGNKLTNALFGTLKSTDWITSTNYDFGITDLGGIVPKLRDGSTELAKMQQSTAKWKVDLSGVLSTFSQLAQVSGGLEQTVKGIASVTGGVALGGSISAALQVQQRDAQGNLAWQKDAKGAYVLDAAGNKIPIMGNSRLGTLAGIGMAAASTGLQLGSLTDNRAAGAALGAVGGGVSAGITAGAAWGAKAGWYGAAAGAAIGALGGLYSASKNKQAQYAAKDAGMAQILGQYGGDLQNLLGEMAGLRQGGFTTMSGQSFLSGWFGDPKAFTKVTTELTNALAKEDAAVTKLGTSLASTAQAQGVLTREQMASLAATRSGNTAASQQALDFVTGQRDYGTQGAITAAQALIARGTVDGLGAASQATGAALMASYFAQQQDGVSALDLLRGDLGASLSGLAGLGVGGAGVAHLGKLAGIASGEGTGQLVSIGSGLGAALTGYLNAGMLGGEGGAQLFADLTAGITESITALQGLGVSGTDASALLASSLQGVWQAQQDFAFDVDDATQALLDQALEAGQIGDHMRPQADRMVVAVETMSKGFTTFLADLPSTMAAAWAGLPESTLPPPSVDTSTGAGSGESVTVRVEVPQRDYGVYIDGREVGAAVLRHLGDVLTFEGAT